MSTPGRVAREALTKVQPVPLAGKKQEVRPLLVDRKEAKEEATKRRQQILKREEEKENRVRRKEEQATNSRRRSVAVAPRK